MQLRPSQQEARDAILREWDSGTRKTLLVLPTGTGKCLGKGTKVLMFSGDIKNVEDVIVGDLLMGPDSKQRSVMSICRGREPLYKVIPTKGEPYVVNESHIISLKRTKEKSRPRYPSHRKYGEIVNIEVRDYVAKSKWWKHVHKGWRAAVDWPDRGNSIVMEPWLLGVWLGDGSSRTPSITSGDPEIIEELRRIASENNLVLREENNSANSKNYHFASPKGVNGCKGGANPILNHLKHYGLLQNKHIPAAYKTASAAVRLEVLAGIIDTDGSLTTGGYDVCLTNERLLDDVIFIARSLGFSAYKRKRTAKCHNNGAQSTAWRTCISGDCDKIPCRVARKRSAARRQKKDVLSTGIKVEPHGVGEYYGFELGGPDRLFLLGDFTVTHNTIVFCSLAEEIVRRGRRVLILAHRGELLDQAAEKLHLATGLACAVEKADQTCLGEWERMTVGSVQSMMRPDRLARFPRDYFGTVIVDEAHHALADSYQRVLDHFEAANILGVTATPDRGDRRNLGMYFHSLAYEYGLHEAIQQGYLCKIMAATLPLKLDIASVKVQAGDYQVSGLATALDPYLKQIAVELETYRDRKTVVFLPLIATSQKFRDILQAHGFDALEVNGESRDRVEILERWDAMDRGVLCNSMLLTEGWDCPSVDCIVCLRPTKIRSLYAQMIGRGTRLHPGKENLLILDFLWHTANHELIHPAHLIAESEEIAAKAVAIQEEDAGAEMDLEELVEAAESEVLEERENALAERLKEMRNKKGKLVDPLQFEASIGAEDLLDYQPAFGWEMAPATDKQVQALEKFGIYPGDIECAGKAKLLLDRLSKRREMHLATPKQIRLLERKGFQHVGQWDFSAASKMIDRIAVCGWRTPAGVDPATYRPETKMQEGFGFEKVPF